ncbi:class I SAM-dependent methyltransferase [soil metagenome]
MKICPICAHGRFVRFLSRPQVPVHQHLVLATSAEAFGIRRGNLEMVACEECGFVFNAAFDERLLSYGEQYDNSQSHSTVFADYLDGIVRDLVLNRGVRDCHVVEVGCGKGEFLRRLVGFPGANLRATGFDPSYLGPCTDLDGRLSFRRSFYGPEAADVSADVVICRHVIEHVADPVALLRSVRAAVRGAGAHVFFETPSVEWILANRVLWDFFYEHCSLFSAESFEAAFRLAGFRVSRLDRVFGDQYFFLEAHASDAVEPRYNAREIPDLATSFADYYDRKLVEMTQRLKEASAAGPVALWGAGAKGTALANLVDPDRLLISCLVDVNPAKQGRFVPGSGHAIVGPAELGPSGIRTAILMNPNYRGEVLDLIKGAGISCSLVELE